MKIAHQYTDASLKKLGPVEGVEFAANDPAAPYRLPEGTDALLLDPENAGGLNHDTPRPEGWPGAVEWAHLSSTGIDYVPDWLLEVPILTVSRGAQATAISEYVMGCLLDHVQDLPAMRVTDKAQWEKHRFGNLAGKTLGLLGFGEIGKAIARRALAFDMEVLAARRHEGPSGMEGVEAAPKEEVLARADALVLCLPLTEATRGILDAQAFARMKEGAHLVNIARGAHVDQDALKAALDEGSLARASLDVATPEPPEEGHWLYTHPRVHLTAHTSWKAPSTTARMRAILRQNLEAWRDGEREALHGVVSKEGGY